MDGKRGKIAVVILHPDFDKPGREGIEEAAAYAQRMVRGANDLAAQATASGDVPEAEIRAYLSGFRYVVRRVPEALL